jgi:hypothetical protein
MKLIVLIGVVLAVAVMVPAAALGAILPAESGSPQTVHASGEADTEPPVIEWWYALRYQDAFLWIDAILIVSDDTSEEYTARVKLVYRGHTVRLMQDRFTGYCDSTDAVYLQHWLSKFKHGKYTAYVSAWDEAGNKSKAAHVHVVVR